MKVTEKIARQLLLNIHYFSISKTSTVKFQTFFERNKKCSAIYRPHKKFFVVRFV